MRKIYTLLAAAAFATSAHAQSSFNDTFDSYTLGAYVAQASPQWTTWSNAPGGPEDAQVVNTQAVSGTQSIYFNSTAAGGGPQDLVLPFGGVHTTGTFRYEMKMYIPTNKGAYFNFQGDLTPGNIWVLDAYFLNGGNFNVTASGSTVASGTFPHGQWFTVAFDINLNTNTWDVLIDNVNFGTFSNPNNQIAAIDIYPYNAASNGGNNQSQFWVDDVFYDHIPYTLPARNGAVVGAGSINPATFAPSNLTGYAGQQREVGVLVRNLGTSPITSFDISLDYNGTPQSTTITGVNIPSLGYHTVNLSTPVTLASGNNPLLAVISNINGQGSDDDPADDSLARNINITVTPANYKRVLVEEGTGTWCQWCPRGAVYMDYMAEEYHDVFVGIAVHNGDPMTIANYDGPFSQTIGGYPSIRTDRGTESDPLDIEAEVLGRLTQAPSARIINGAVWNPTTRQLDVSITYDLLIGIDNTWRTACVILEDSVTGTTGYGQSNAYAGGNNGPMGGFELLPGTVPAAQMNYNHVARFLSPNFFGAAAFSGSLTTGTINTMTYTFTLPADIDENQVHIAGLLINPNEEVDNVSYTTIAEAVTNGYTGGTPIVGITTPTQPDAPVSLYPNPTNGDAYLQFSLSQDTELSVTLTDLQGRTIAHQDYGTLNGAHTLPIRSSQLAKGTYLVRATLNGTPQVHRLVIQ